MRNLREIKDILLTNKAALFSNYSLQSLAIFGSYSRNSANETSDLDIMVDFKTPIGIKFIDLAEELEELLNIKVELVSKKGIKEKYLKAIESDLIYV